MTVLLFIFASNPIVYLVGSVLVMLVYFVGMESSYRNATIGKILFNLRVATTNQRPVPLGQAFLRHLIWWTPFFPMMIYLCSPAYTEFMQAIHSQDIELMHTLKQSEAVTAVRQAILWTTAGGSLAAITLFWLPTFWTKERIGLIDLLSGTRVYQINVTPSKQPFASAWQRTGASILDTIIYLIAAHTLQLFTKDLIILTIFGIAFGAIYYVILEGMAGQATVGKRMVNIYVAPCSEEKMSLKFSAMRYFYFMLPMLPFYAYYFSSDVLEVVTTFQSYAQEAATSGRPRLTAHTYKILMNVGLLMLGCGTIHTTLNLISILEKTTRAGLHDLLSGTRVYRGKPQPQPSKPSTHDAAA